MERIEEDYIILLERIKANHQTQFAKFKVQKQNLRRLWNISEKCAELLFLLILAKKPKRILEIGTSNGYSTFWLSLAAESCVAVIDTI